MIIGAELLLEGFAKSDLNDFMRLLSGDDASRANFMTVQGKRLLL
jgi:hypothetical protein